TNWSPLATFRNINDMWQHIEIDLSDYADQRIYIAFNVYGDTMVSGAGWYLDDVTLSDTSIFTTQSNSLLPNIKYSLGDINENNQDKQEMESQLGLANKYTGETLQIPEKQQDVTYPASIEYNNEKTDEQANTEAASFIPLDAKVTIQELNRYMETDVRDGSYSMIVPEGKYTLQSEAYGYFPATEQVEVGDQETATEDFTLQ